MTLLFVDGFDHYSLAQMPRKWTVMTGTTFTAMQTGRASGQSVQRTTSSGGANNNTVGVNITASTTVIAGFAFKIAAGGTNGAWGEICAFDNGPNALAYIRAQNTGAVSLLKYDGSTILGTSATGVLAVGKWYYMEAKLVVNQTTGSFEIKVDGTTVLTLTNVDTGGTGHLTQCNRFALGPLGWNSVDFRFDDLYILNNSGSVNNTYLGPCVITTTYPNGTGNSTQLTPTGSATNYGAVSDNPANDDTSYVSGSGSNLIDLYTIPSLVTQNTSLFGVQTNLQSRIDDAGPHTLRSKARSSGNNYNGASVNPTASYALNYDIWESDPATSAAWTVANFNNAQFGEEVVS